ncbi:unnamed protein product [Candidula unifasciata]|uniref:Uncharacterized protein n=1 Tax=Candidula unifasciata TaxID=100452 RepID=A0A8S3ZBE6_9EUPU|nr:unnamed protein product [Candidula unifasciata]
MGGSETEESETNSLKKLYEEFGGSTSMHGINRVLTTTSTWKRCVWSVLFLFGVAFAVYQFVITMEDFYSYPVTTVVTLKQETTAIFPGVTFCNLNKKRKSMIDPELLAAISLLEETEEAAGDAILNGLMYNDSMVNGDKAGHQISNMLMKCIFNRRECFSDNFTKIETASYGTCYTFEITDPELQWATRPGPQTGLLLEINIEHYEYLPTTSKAGVLVIVHPVDETPFPEDGGILAHPGVITSIGVKQELTQRLPSPYSNCISADVQSSSLRSLFANKRYMQNACMKSCFQLAVHEKCKCCNVDLPCDYYKILNVDRTTSESNHSLPICSTPAELLCESQVENLFLKSELDCDELCPPVCDRTTFDTVVSAGLWPSDLSSDSVETITNSSVVGNMTFTDYISFERFIRSNFLKIDVFLDTLEFKEFTTQAKYDWNLLLGTVSGLLGLWLGFSLLTAMEIVEVLIDTVVFCTRRRKKK